MHSPQTDTLAAPSAELIKAGVCVEADEGVKGSGEKIR